MTPHEARDGVEGAEGGSAVPVEGSGAQAGSQGVGHDAMVHRNGDHFWLTCCDWRHDPASNDPDDGIRWAEWDRALQAHVADRAQ